LSISKNVFKCLKKIQLFSTIAQYRISHFNCIIQLAWTKVVQQLEFLTYPAPFLSPSGGFLENEPSPEKIANKAEHFIIDFQQWNALFSF